MGTMVSRLETTMYGNRRLEILMVGRGFASKSTILHRLKHGEFVKINTVTIFDVETVDYKDVTFGVLDIGGQLKMLTLWKSYFRMFPALIYVIDSNDRDRITDARNELVCYMKEIEDEPKKANILVYANKQDLPGAMSVTEIIDKLDLKSLGQHSWHVQAASAVTGKGLYDGLDWVYRHLYTTG